MHLVSLNKYFGEVNASRAKSEKELRGYSEMVIEDFLNISSCACLMGLLSVVQNF